MVRRVGDAAAAADDLPSNAHRHVRPAAAAATDADEHAVARQGAGRGRWSDLAGRAASAHPMQAHQESSAGSAGRQHGNDDARKARGELRAGQAAVLDTVIREQAQVLQGVLCRQVQAMQQDEICHQTQALWGVLCRQVQAMRDSFEARRQADIAEEAARARSAEAAAATNMEAAVRSGDVVARRAAAAEAAGPGTRGGQQSAGGRAAGAHDAVGGASDVGGTSGQRSVSAAFRQELAEASAAASVRSAASPQFK